MKGPIHGFSRTANDLFKIATLIAGFDAKELMLEIHRRCPNRADEDDISNAMQRISDRAKEAK